MAGKRGFTLAVLSVLCLFLLFSCAPATGELTRDAMISLSIGSSSASRSIGVTQYDVSSLDVEIYSPGGGLLWSVSWTPDQGMTTYDIEVEIQGTHEIVVVHHGINGDEEVSATESQEFTIASMLITVINITPGAIGVLNIDDGDVTEPCPIVGVWENDLNWGEVMRLHMEFDSEGNANQLMYEYDEDGVLIPEIADNSLKGTYECLENLQVGGFWTHSYWEDGWMEYEVPEKWQVGVEFQDDDNKLIVDVSAYFGEGAFWELYRQ